jgi:predicted nucleotidyltransferase
MRLEELTAMLTSDLRELLLAFNEQNVEYLLVGGYAVGFHAQPRATKDLDVFVRSDAKNSEAVFNALASFGAPLDGLSPSDFRSDPGSVFQVGVEPARIDILQQIDGITFAEAWEQRVKVSIEGLRVHIISSEHLIRNKLASGRPQDIADVAAIRKMSESLE